MDGGAKVAHAPSIEIALAALRTGVHAARSPELTDDAHHHAQHPDNHPIHRVAPPAAVWAAIAAAKPAGLSGYPLLGHEAGNGKKLRRRGRATDVHAHVSGQRSRPAGRCVCQKFVSDSLPMIDRSGGLSSNVGAGVQRMNAHFENLPFRFEANCHESIESCTTEPCSL